MRWIFLFARRDMPSSMNIFHVNHAMLIALLCSLACFVILMYISVTLCVSWEVPNWEIWMKHTLDICWLTPFCHFSNCFIWWTYGWGGCLEQVDARKSESCFPCKNNNPIFLFTCKNWKETGRGWQMNISYFEWAVALLKSSLADMALWVESMVRACNCRNFRKWICQNFRKWILLLSPTFV